MNNRMTWGKYKLKKTSCNHLSHRRGCDIMFLVSIYYAHHIKIFLEPQNRWPSFDFYSFFPPSPSAAANLPFSYNLSISSSLFLQMVSQTWSQKVV